MRKIGGDAVRRCRRSWLASEGVGRVGAGLAGLFAGKPAPTGKAPMRKIGGDAARRCRRSWLASEGGGRAGAGLAGLFAGKPAPTGKAPMRKIGGDAVRRWRRSWLASEGVGRLGAGLAGRFAGKPAPTGKAGVMGNGGAPAPARCARQGRRRGYQVRTAPTAKVSVFSFCAVVWWPSISNWLYSATSLRLSLMSWNSATPRVW
ncbi:hypothetical protein SAMN05216178_3831 [Pseudomonas saponiphila]|uniref:Uncharacterized protein n=1 Tax=Pseudomonas saponiphila TaxID=556534 RepID=A0A1H4QM84_9PSED|nr:hypothetical protein SAMN05216178_3831 [Pseudomonas saponiphila]